MALEWMAWTLPTAVFFTCIVLMLLGMGVWHALVPTVERRGLLPIATTRGDRLFIGLLGALSRIDGHGRPCGAGARLGTLHPGQG